MSRENAEEFANQAEAGEAPEEIFVDGAELDADKLDQISGGRRMVGGVMKYGKRELEALVCPKSPLPKRRHRYERIGCTEVRGFLTTEESGLYQCIYCGRQVTGD